MAYATKLGALTEELVTLLTSTSVNSDPARFNLHRESALRALRHHNFARTNQFDVTSQFDGLDEKFRVLLEDPLADALKERLNILAKLEVKWAPEILHLLLELSDRPVEKSKLENLDFLKEPEPDPGPTLKWKDLIAEDPLLRDKSVWQNVDFGAESSDGEDGFEDSRSELSGLTNTTLQSSVDEEFNQRPEDYAIDTINKEDLDQLRDAQFWQKTPTVDGVQLETVKTTITELQAIREVLFMLLGLPTSLFEILGEGPIVPKRKYALKHASADAFFKVGRSFSEQGTAVMRLRSWAKRDQSIPLIQVLQSSILCRTVEFDARISDIQQRFVSPVKDIVVSLLSVQAEVSSYMRPLVRLSEIIKKLEDERYPHAFRYLELLYDEACTSQLAGDGVIYSFIGRLFFECFKIYLRPIRKWMEDGELTKGDKVFFILEASGDIEPTLLWQSRFKIRRTQDGVLHAPRFLQAAANRIFTTGKSVVVLKHLNQFDSLQSVRGDFELSLDFDSVCNPEVLGYAPFPELFDSAFHTWVESKHHSASSMLRRILFDSCGLQTSLDALSHLYFLADGATASVFTNSIFDKLDTLDLSWNDRYTLTELAQSTFGAIPSLSSDRLRTSVLTLSRKHQDVAKCRRTVKVLSILELKYHLSWPIQIILTPATISTYQRIFTFLLQIRRSSHILSRQRLITDGLTKSSSSDERALYYSLRTRLLWFTQMLYYYLTSLVLEPLSQKMRADLKATEDVDTMIEVHTCYIKTTIDQALLGSKLELIHRTILKILDLGIKLEDAQAANAAANKEALEKQQEMMDLSMASLGLHTPQRKGRSRPLLKEAKGEAESSSDDDEQNIDVDLSILSSTFDEKGDLWYFEKLRNMKTDFDGWVRFVASGLRGVARAGGGGEARSWDTLGEMLENGLDAGGMGHR
ncbi:Spc98 family-domain-containing protein [Hyaloscypha sp. PMI_1271]|nr:Spc98 family-domain-containing protein [Hyaloscypha sp. PMI_1271]